MKLHLRLSLYVSLLILLCSTSIGFFSINSSYRNQIQILDKNITNIIKKISTSKENPLSLSTYLADESSLKFSVSYITPELNFISLYEGEYENSEISSTDVLKNSIEKASTFEQVRYRAFEFSPGEYLLFYFPLFEINKVREANILYLFLFTALITATSILISFWVFKKDSEINSVANSLKINQEHMREFIGDASHELKTPLTIIKGYFELLERNIDDSNKAKSYNSRIRSEIIRMQNIINDLLLIAELDEFKTTSESVTPISSLIEEQILDLQNLQSDRELTVRVDQSLNVQVPEFYVNQLLSNLFSNVIRYTPPDSKVEIFLGHNFDRVRLEIEDSGPGLPEMYYSDGIQAFKRFDKSRSRESGGSGLGMTIVHKIVDSYGGSVKLDKSKYGGLKVVIELPKA